MVKRRKKKKFTKVKLLRCPDPDCGIVFATLIEYYDHLDSGGHCPECGFAVDPHPTACNPNAFFCPACRLAEVSWPKDCTMVS